MSINDSVQLLCEGFDSHSPYVSSCQPMYSLFNTNTSPDLSAWSRVQSEHQFLSRRERGKKKKNGGVGSKVVPPSDTEVSHNANYLCALCQQNGLLCFTWKRNVEFTLSIVIRTTFRVKGTVGIEELVGSQIGFCQRHGVFKLGKTT